MSAHYSYSAYMPKAKGKSPTSHTTGQLKKQGVTYQIVEKWNQHAKVRQDLFGFVDILAMRDNKFVGIQATSATNHSTRLKKAMAEPRLIEWLNCGGKFEVWSWKQDDKTKRWSVRIDEVKIPALEVGCYFADNQKP